MENSATTGKAWYLKPWGILVSLIFFPFFILWYTWFKSNWGKGVKIGITLFILFIFIIGSSTSIEDSNDNKSRETEQSQKEITVYIDIDDFQKTELDSIIEKYGESESGFENTSPLSSQYVIDNKDFTLQATYFDTDKRVFGAQVFLHSYSCKEDEKYSERQIKELFEYVGADYYDKVSFEYNKKLNRFKGSYYEWQDIFVSCNDGEAVISFNSKGYLER